MIVKRTALLWTLAVVVTLASGIYQRRTGPTYPLSGKAELQGTTIDYSLPRSHGGDGDQEIRITAGAVPVTGVLEWKRHKTNDAWTSVAMDQDAGGLVASLPHQPPAGKLDYKIVLRSGDARVHLPADGGVVIRFRGDVPAPVLVTHVVIMFLSMLFSVRAGLELFGTGGNLKPMMYVTLVLMGVGGLILGPIVQKYAFDAYWTGWPFGHDMTDNKTLVAFLAWGVAVVMLHRGKDAARWACGAAVVTLIVFLIPHSVLGSELNYEEMDKEAAPASVVFFLPVEDQRQVAFMGTGPVPSIGGEPASGTPVTA
jgi:hypothetical protein